MAAEKTKKKELTGEELLSQMSQEEILEKAKRNISIAEVLPDIKLKAEAYSKTLELLTYILKNGASRSEDEDSSVMDEAQKMRVQTQKDRRNECAALIISKYKKACAVFENSKTAEAVKAAQSQLEDVTISLRKYVFDYEELSDEMKNDIDTCGKSEEYLKECDRRLVIFASRKKKRKIIFTVVLAALVVLAFATLKTSVPRHCMAVVESKIGLTERARRDYYHAYKKSGNQKFYEKYLYYMYEAACDSVEKGDLSTAYKYFKNLKSEGYKDSEEWMTKVELKQMSEAECGNKVHFGGRNWIVVEKEDSKCTLVATKLAAHNVSFSSTGNAWETSDVRAYLNATFIEDTFSDSEKENILLTAVAGDANEEYKTDAGKDTEDRVFILSASELDLYSKYLNDYTVGVWLRTPGATTGNVVFTKENQAMMYGYDSTAEEFGIRPVICVDLTKA